MIETEREIGRNRGNRGKEDLKREKFKKALMSQGNCNIPAITKSTI